MKRKYILIGLLVCVIFLVSILFLIKTSNKNDDNFLKETKEKMQQVISYDVTLNGNFSNSTLTINANVDKSKDPNRFYEILEKSDDQGLSGIYELLFKESEHKATLNLYDNIELITTHDIPLETEEQMKLQNSALLLYTLADFLTNEKVKCQKETCIYTPKNYEKSTLLFLIAIPTFGLYKDYLNEDDNLTLSYTITETTISEVIFNFKDGQSFKLTFSNFR